MLRIQNPVPPQIRSFARRDFNSKTVHKPQHGIPKSSKIMATIMQKAMANKPFLIVTPGLEFQDV